MKKIQRSKEPTGFFNSEEKRNYYINLRNKAGKIQDRWNLDSVRHELRSTLLDMSKNECSYCGRKISAGDMDIDHYLPKEKFPYLSYSFENYLPSCKHCNQSLKRNFSPKSLEKYNSMLGEEILESYIPGILSYHREDVLKECEDRIIEPSYDSIESHLQFDALSILYRTKTEIGENTNKIFFHHREAINELHKISKLVRQLINEGVTKDSILEIADLMGYRFYFEAFYEYWIDL